MGWSMPMQGHARPQTADWSTSSPRWAAQANAVADSDVSCRHRRSHQAGEPWQALVVRALSRLLTVYMCPQPHRLPFRLGCSSFSLPLAEYARSFLVVVEDRRSKAGKSRVKSRFQRRTLCTRTGHVTYHEGRRVIRTLRERR